MDKNFIVIDNFYNNVDDVREYALEQQFQTEGNYPGLRTLAEPDPQHGYLKTFFEIWLPIVPLMAVLFGFLPGCGPQIVVTTFYLNGFIPLSAEIGNAISNDGDALFPAIALTPKAAIIATLYSAVPAIVFAYGFMFIFE